MNGRIDPIYLYSIVSFCNSGRTSQNLATGPPEIRYLTLYVSKMHGDAKVERSLIQTIHVTIPVRLKEHLRLPTVILQMNDTKILVHLLQLLQQLMLLSRSRYEVQRNSQSQQIFQGSSIVVDPVIWRSEERETMEEVRGPLAMHLPNRTMKKELPARMVFL